MNKKSFKSYIIVVLVTAIVTSFCTVFLITDFGKYRLVPRDFVKTYGKAYSMQKEIESQFYQKVDKKKLETGIYKGLFAGLDDIYSAYFTKEEMQKLNEQTSGHYVGLGIVVSPDVELNAIKIVGVFPNSSASKAGLKAGDVITEVDGKKYGYQELDVAVKHMRGKEGSVVKLKISSNGKEISKEVTRAKVVLESISSKMLDKNIGYIKIISFDEDTAKDFKKALDKLQKENMKGLIIDLRDNGGGLLSSVVDISDQLLGKADVVYTQDRAGQKEYFRSDDRMKVSVPIVVLTNGYTASASEILTGALVDNKAGISIGTTTFGKGVVQSIFTLPDGTGYKVTTSQYFTPSGKSINKKGIKPTIEVKDPKKQLDEAVSYLEKQIK